MLVLKRKANETIVIGAEIEVSIVRVRGNTVTIGITAPKDIKVMRKELLVVATEGSIQVEGFPDDCC